MAHLEANLVHIPDILRLDVVALYHLLNVAKPALNLYRNGRRNPGFIQALVAAGLQYWLATNEA
jgi:hypothetical protein